jgi:hypothetical protein
MHLTHDARYVPPGETRTATRKTVAVQGKNTLVQCCPYMSVDKEVDFICDEAKVWSPPSMYALFSCDTDRSTSGLGRRTHLRLLVGCTCC